MLKKWLQKYKQDKNILNLNEKDQTKLTKRLDNQSKVAKKKIEEWILIKNKV